MMKKLLTAFFAVAALVVVVPSAEARWFGKNKSCGTKSCAPKSCEKPCAPQCDVKKEIVGQRVFPCCRMVKEEGYQVCPLERTTKCCTTEATRCCLEQKSSCIYPGDAKFRPEELSEAHGKSGDMDHSMADADRAGGAKAQHGSVRGGARAHRAAAMDEASDMVE